MNEPGEKIDWSLTTWEGSRRAQLRHWCALTLRERLSAVEEMGDLAQHFSTMRSQGRFLEPSRRSLGDTAEVPKGRYPVREPRPSYGTSVSVHELTLSGCTPEPLMNYLKALGVLRLVGEQADAEARGYWRDDVFVLRSTLTKEGLIQLFTQQYQPTPVLSPWNGDGGFLSESGAACSTLQQVKTHADPRFERIRSGISGIEQMTSMRELSKARRERKDLEGQLNAKYGTKADKWKKRATDEEKQLHSQLEKRAKKIKEDVISQLRADFPDESLGWLDACLLVETEGFTAAPLLGSGGVDGRMEFSANFLANVLAVMESEARISESWLSASLFQSLGQIIETSIGQFAPGRIGGPNATQGLEGASLLNPWDYVLMIEGVVLFAGAVSRKLGVGESAKSSFPFTVISSPAGEESLVDSESRTARGEIWMPLWNRPAGVQEIRHLIAEGRSEWAGHQSRTAVDFARAIAGLGVDRGIASFSRQGFLKRNGLAFIATPLGRFEVKLGAQVDLLREIDPWMDRLRRAFSGDTPARLLDAGREIDRCIFNYCRYGGARDFQAVLIALGRMERELMRDGTWAVKNRVPPLAGLSEGWASAVDDDSLEFDLALSLARLYDPEHKLGPLRSNLEPVTVGRRQAGETFIGWAQKDRSAVWNAAALPANLRAVLDRRTIDASRVGCDRLPLASTHAASLQAVSVFLAGETDDRKLEQLLWGLALTAQETRRRQQPPVAAVPSAAPLPRTYALLKLLFLPFAVVLDRDARGEPFWRYARKEKEGIEIRPEPQILALLRADRVGEASTIAMRRLRASGFAPMPHGIAAARNRDSVWSRSGGSLDGNRLAAALLVPISSRSVNRLFGMVVRRQEKFDNEAPAREGENA